MRTREDEDVKALAVVRRDDLELVEVRVDHGQEARWRVCWGMWDAG